MNIEEAKSIIENQKQQEVALSKITSTSKAGVWVQLKFVYAVISEWIFSQWAEFRLELEALVHTRRWATTEWYIEKAQAFQLGDMLELLDNGGFGYRTINAEKQIIAQAAIEVHDRELLFKVAGETSGELFRISNEHMQLFKSYINQIKRPGTPIHFINYDPDRLVLSLRVYFDGELFEHDVESEIRDTVKNYLNKLVFNGVFSVTKLIDQVQKVKGVTECIYLEGAAWPATKGTSGEIKIKDRYRAVSGYFKIAKQDNLELLHIEMHREI